MKLYIKNYWIKFLLCCGIFLFVFFISGLTETFNWQLTAYLMGVGSFLFLVYFAVDYYMKRQLYAFLSGQTNRIESGDTNPESLAIQRKVSKVLKDQEIDLMIQSEKREQQVTFMNLWVHQMKTPLTALEMLAQENQLDSDAVLAETQRLKSGLDLALNEARLVEGIEKDFVLKQVSLSEIVNKVINAQKNYFIQYETYPVVRLDEDIIVITDEKWLFFIIEQLLINAIKYSHPKGNILIETKLLDEKPNVIINDFGIGIPREDLFRVWQPFFTGENGRNSGEAAGMGLYLVELAANPLGIMVEIDSSEGQGTTASVEFPKQQS
ncbi:sensor histidine kinase [Enterococcus sp. BWB1-3]|uniref:sensor histidine kinase n=1 Tax=Enterococcus sp. BWB1-3 TaxID=2787713 RepID=UPI00192124E7|nr:sensor histidine kinase [Enterococcus sp. BWB1-3]MBL1229742.1 sensor histidine kinase [Enterococcus sp. BWB1-3]